MLIAIACFAVVAMSFKGSYKSLWKQVEDYNNKNEIITALDVLKSIQDKAVADGDKAFGHYMKAYLMSLSMSEDLGKTSSQEGIKQLENLLSNITNPQQKAILNYFLFGEYIRFFKENGYVFADRTDLSDADSLATDLLLWSPNQFEQKIKEHFNAIFVDKTELLKTPSKDFQPLIEQSEFGYIFNNDLYHPLLFGAISQVTSNSYNLDLKNIKDDLEDKLKEGLNDYSSNPSAQVVLLMYHFDMTSESKSKAEKIAEYKSLIDKYKDTDVIVEVVNKYATLQLSDNDVDLNSVKALCEEYIAKYPKYKRINILKELIQNIESPRLFVSTEFNVYPNFNFVESIRYKNISKVVLELYQVDSKIVNPNDSVVDENFIKRYSTLVQTKTIDNLSTPDYKEKKLDNIEFSTPKVGFYILKMSADNKGIPSYSKILSSNIKVAYVYQPTGVDIYTLDAQRGLPISGVTIDSYTNCDQRKDSKRYVTDENGKVSLVSQRGNSVCVSIKKNKDIAEYNKSLYVREKYVDSEKARLSGTILSDRAVYRPGQKLYLKGYLYEYNSSDGYNVAVNHKDSVVITDGSGAELIKLPFTTNEYGTFSLEYNLPEQILLGSFGVNIQNIAFKRLRVEEYKRPTFSISFDKINNLYSSEDKIKVVGRVDAFNGSLLKGAKLTVNVSLYNRILPFILIPKGKDKLLSHDVLELNSDGSFEVEVDPQGKTGYINVSATLTTLGGESQEMSKMVRVQKNAIVVQSGINSILDKDKDITLLVNTTNLDSTPIALDGKYELFIKNEKDSLVKVLDGKLESNTEQIVTWSKLKSGQYQLKYTFNSGKDKSESSNDFILFSTADKVLPLKSNLWIYTPDLNLSENGSVKYNVGTDLNNAEIITLYYTNNGLVKNTLQKFNHEMKSLEINYEKAYQNGLTVVFLLVKDNKVYTQSFSVTKKIVERPILLGWSTFRDKIKPGAKEMWRLNIKEASSALSSIELLALMYDASLDQIAKTDYSILKFARSGAPAVYVDLNNFDNTTRVSFVHPNELKIIPFIFDSFVEFDSYFPYGGWPRTGIISGLGTRRQLGEAKVMIRGVSPKMNLIAEESIVPQDSGDMLVEEVNDDNSNPITELRTNFSETAFFLPHLYPNNKGEVMIEFESPEQLTKWNVKALAHDKKMNTGTLNSSTYTVKEFTVSPNVPRFIRRGDNMEIASTIKNGTDKQKRVTVKFTWFNPITNKTIKSETQNITVDSKDEAVVSITAIEPKGLDNLGFRVEAISEKYSDGEQHIIPILSDKEYLNEGIAFYKYDKGESILSLAGLFNGLSNTATDKSLTIEFTNDPIWYLMNPLMSLWSSKSEGTINISNRLYANLIGYTFQKEYKEFLNGYTTSTSKNNLFNNEELLDITLQESPWNLRALKQKEMLGQFNRLVNQNASIIAVRSLLFDLRDKQKADGGWEWYEGLGSSDYITYYITSVLNEISKSEYASYFREDINNMMSRGVQYLLIKYTNKEGKLVVPSTLGLSDLQLMKIIGNKSVLSKLDKSVSNFYTEALKNVPSLLSEKSIALRAIAATILINAGQMKEAKPFVESLKQYLLEDASGLKYYGEKTFNNLGINAQLDAHIAAANAIYTYSKDEALFNSMKGWVVMKLQREVSYNPFQMFNVFQFLSSKNLVSADNGVTISLNNKVYKLDNKSPYLKETIQLADNVKLSDIKIVKNSDAPLWGGVVGSYFENIENVESYKSEISVDQKLYKEIIKNNNKELQPINKDEIKPGDIIVSRVEFTLEENLDFLYLKVDRSSALEPFDILSGPNYSLLILYRDNMYLLGNKYVPSYKSVKDASTEYFYNSLEKGTYVLETRSYAARKGSYQSGLVRLQSLYSPEISAHSKSLTFRVR